MVAELTSGAEDWPEAGCCCCEPNVVGLELAPPMEVDDCFPKTGCCVEDVVLEDAEAGWLNMDVELAEGDDDGWPKTTVEPEADAEEAGD